MLSKKDRLLTYHLPGSVSLIHSAVKTSKLWKIGSLKVLLSAWKTKSTYNAVFNWCACEHDWTDKPQDTQETRITCKSEAALL